MNPNSSAVICISCLSGFFLANNVCTLGNVNNCDVYTNVVSTNQINTCVTCLSNFVLTQTAGSLTYCYPIDTSLNCVNYNTNSNINNPSGF